MGGTDTLDRVIEEVERRCLRDRIPMLGPEKALFLRNLVHSRKPSLVVECGTAIGYSGLFIADGLRRNGRGRLLTLEIARDRSRRARRYFDRAGVGDLVETLTGDAVEILKSLDSPVDFLFLDNSFSNYMPCFRAAEPVLVDGAAVVADNVEIGREQMEDYLSHVRALYRSETHPFEVDLPWVTRDAMEVTSYHT